MPGLVAERDRPLAVLQREYTDGLDSLLRDIQASVNDPGEVVDPQFVAHWVHTAKRLSVMVSNDLPPQLNLGAVAEIRGIIVNLLDELAEIDKDRPLDAFDRFFVKAEAVRHIIRDALDEHVGCREDDAKPLVASMREALPRITQADQARLVGLSLRHFQRLGKEGGMPPRQLVLAAKLVKLLRYVWNPEGTLAWFYRERKQLDGHAPIELMADPGFEQMLLGLAREGRALHAA